MPLQIRFSVFVLFCLLAGCSSPQVPEPTPLVYHRQYSANVSTIYGPVNGSRRNQSDPLAPNFYWRDSLGRLDSLNGHNDKIVVLNFWATWCVPCQGEMPDIQAVSTEATDVEVISVSEDANGDAYGIVKNYVNNNHLTFTTIVDSDFLIYNRYFEDFGIPQTFIIGTDGRIHYRQPQAASKQLFDSLISKVR